MIVINYGHQLGADQLAKIGELTKSQIGEVRQVPCQLDNSQPTAPQATGLVMTAGLTPEQWQRGGYVVVLPGLSVAAACVLAEIHGRAGHFPAVVRMAPVVGATPPRFAVAEIVGLQQLRDDARAER